MLPGGGGVQIGETNLMATIPEPEISRNFRTIGGIRQRALARPNPKSKANGFRRYRPSAPLSSPRPDAHPPTPPTATLESREAQPPRGPSPCLGLRSPRSPPMSTSKKTRGLLGLEGLVWGDGCDIVTCRRAWKPIPGTSWLQSHRNPNSGCVHGDLKAALTSHFRRQDRKLQLDFRRRLPAALPRAGTGARRVPSGSIFWFSLYFSLSEVAASIFLSFPLVFHRLGCHRGVGELRR